MRKMLRCSLAVAGIFGAASASAATIDPSVLQSYGKQIYDYVNANASSMGLSATDLASMNQIYGAIATAPAAQIAQVVSVTNSTLLSSANCVGLAGAYSTAAYSTNFSPCIMDLATAVVTAVPNYDPMAAGGAAGLALLYYAGGPLTVPGTNVVLGTTTPPPVTPPTTPPPTTPTTAAKVVSDIVVPQIQRATSIQQASIISNVVSNIFSSRTPNSPGAPMRVSLGNEKGMSAGNEAAKLNAWVNASDTTLGNSAAASLFDGNVTNAIAGLDYMVSDKFVAGVSVGSDRVSLDYKFAANSGLVSTGWMVAPYASYQLSDIVSVDGALGYASGDADYRDSGVISTKSYDRNFIALNLNANYWIKDLQLTGKVNYISAEEKVATTNKMEQLRLGGQVGYWFGGIMPYASLTYVLDLKVSAGGIQPANVDKEAWVAAVGANLFSKGALYGGIAYTHEFARADSKNDTFMANIGYRF